MRDYGAISDDRAAEVIENDAVRNGYVIAYGHQPGKVNVNSTAYQAAEWHCCAENTEQCGPHKIQSTPCNLPQGRLNQQPGSADGISPRRIGHARGAPWIGIHAFGPRRPSAQ